MLKIVKRFACLSAIGLLATQICHAQVHCLSDTRPVDASTRFVVKRGAVILPIGAFLLVRRDGHVGAIRITGIEPNGSEWLGRFKYESYFQLDGSTSFAAGTAVKNAAELDIGESKGWHAVYQYGGGHHIVSIGPWKFKFYSLTMMAMVEPSFWTGEKDRGFEFAPTSACDVSAINVNDQSLRWFRFDKNADVTLPLMSLPK